LISAKTLQNSKAQQMTILLQMGRWLLQQAPQKPKVPQKYQNAHVLQRVRFRRDFAKNPSASSIHLDPTKNSERVSGGTLQKFKVKKNPSRPCVSVKFRKAKSAICLFQMGRWLFQQKPHKNLKCSGINVYLIKQITHLFQRKLCKNPEKAVSGAVE
jgi:hypothetical protein